MRGSLLGCHDIIDDLVSDGKWILLAKTARFAGQCFVIGYRALQLLETGA
ncbi:hypothetical protein [uncultured Hoeflea sp.]|tara:strand:+ start:2499 stop:2648 length:150 start_codon:yes stop_codon:yes gene_type:complete